MAGLWDTSDPEPFYLPEEVDQPLRDWDAIHAYWNKTMQLIPRLKMRIWDVKARPGQRRPGVGFLPVSLGRGG